MTPERIAEIKPCVVLDIFAGSGTTLAVAEQLGRDSIGIELNEKYLKIAEKRLARADRTIQMLETL